jgi:preprotein translocase subunit SecD
MKHFACLFALAVGLTGCALLEEKDTCLLRFHEQVSERLPEPHSQRVTVPGTGQTIPVSRFACLTENEVHAAKLAPGPGGVGVLLQFDVHGLIKLDELTTRCRGQYVVIFLDAKPVAAWLVDKRLDKGQFLLEGSFTEDEARQAVEKLNRAARKREAP